MRPENLPTVGSASWELATLARYVLHCRGALLSELDSATYLTASSFITGRSQRELRDDLSVMAYVDDKVVVVGSITSTALGVERVSNHNPVLDIGTSGRVIRYHGEARYIMNRLRAVARETLTHDEGVAGRDVEYQWRRKPASKYVALLGKDG